MPAEAASTRNENVAPRPSPSAAKKTAVTASEPSESAQDTCRISHCHDLLHFAFAEFEGWKPGVRVEVCQGDDCETLVLGARAFEENTFMPGEKRIAHVLTTRSSCPPLPNHDCQRAQFARQVGREIRRGRVGIVGYRFHRGDTVEPTVRLSLSSGDGKSLLEDEVELDPQAMGEAFECYQPNGAGCDPTCCEALHPVSTRQE